MKILNYLIATSLLLMVCHAAAEEVDDKEFGFRFVAPAGFAKASITPEDKDTLYRYAKSEGAEASVAMVMQIQRLRGVIDPAKRINEADFAQLKGPAPTVQTFVWRDLKLDTLRISQSLPDGGTFVVHSIQYPLSGEAVQLQVGGFQEREREVRSLFEDLASKFINTRPLYAPSPKVELRTVRLIEGLERMGAVAVGIGALAFFGIKSLRKKGKKSA